jgi:pSer/pThr/pTyr-binding forkhead associated (FHA) protein
MPALKLTVTNGPNKGRSLILGRSETCLVGRGPQADFVVIDLRISREHFLILGASHGWHILDMQSRHGTFIDGERIKDKWLKRDGVILAGDTTFSVSLFDATIEAEEPTSDPPPHFDCRESTRQTWTRPDG